MQKKLSTKPVCQNCGKISENRIGGLCPYCYESLFPPRQVINFTDLFTRDVLTFRYLLCRMVPPKTQHKIVDLYNDELQEDYQRRLADAKDDWNKMDYAEEDNNDD